MQKNDWSTPDNNPSGKQRAENLPKQKQQHKHNTKKLNAMSVHVATINKTRKGHTSKNHDAGQLNLQTNDSFETSTTPCPYRQVAVFEKNICRIVGTSAMGYCWDFNLLLRTRKDQT